MNKTLAILTLVSALGTTPLLAKEDEAKAPKTTKASKLAKAALNIEERLDAADLEVTVKQYENVRRLEHDAALQAALLDTAGEAKEEERRQLSIRRETLREHAEKLRATAINLAGKLRVRHDEAADAKKN